ncbi:MAG: hypothetical protein QOG54_1006 [Actinomycetota bacterium]|nr:hypothetical protein [Actinomycetota bacterium]
MKKLSLLVVLALVVGGLVPAFAQAPDEVPDEEKNWCFDDQDVAEALEIPIGDEIATGHFSLPTEEPEALVVFAHGYSHNSASWFDHMRRAAADHGVLAVAMDYRGTTGEPGSTRGWWVKEGAVDTIAATKFFQEKCDTIEQTVLFGVSMGGNSSGLALAKASEEASPTGGPLFDYWFDVEGAVNVVETYLGARVLAPANAFAANAQADIEAEMGGQTFEEDPEGYQDLAVMSHLDEIKASGVKGVALVHAIEDGLVPYNQAREMAAGLRYEEIPYEMYTIGRKAPGESGTTITGYAPPLKDQSPFAGHASETSTTHQVMVTALDRLWSLLDDGVGFSDYKENPKP